MTTTRWRRTLLATAILAATCAAGGRAQAAAGDYGTGTLLVPNPDTLALDQQLPFRPPGATPLVGYFVGDTVYGGSQDILWYTPGPGGDALWESRPGGTWRSHPISIDGTFEPVVGQFGNDTEDDIIWYAPGSHPDELWDFNPDGTIRKQALSISGDFQPVVGQFSVLGRDDVIWYSPGPAPDAWWAFGPTGSITSRPLAIDGRFRPLVGHFGCFDAYGPDTFDDVFWYAPGAAPDSVWDFGAKHRITKTSVTVGGTYLPVVGSFTDDGCTDIIWYAPGTTPDHLWNFQGSIAHPTSTPLKIDGRYRPVAGNLFPSTYGYTDVLWWGSGPARDFIWDFSTSGGPAVTRQVVLHGDRTPLVAFFTPGHTSIVDLHS